MADLQGSIVRKRTLVNEARRLRNCSCEPDLLALFWHVPEASGLCKLGNLRFHEYFSVLGQDLG
ncbi:hypothetical protein ES332_A04G143900v1 [Gossypium tomentosum]|uniref:Uncharacterized protein n=1 Tax=Gossypium tomentosum TaxID=34277 RepID=A0A5D2R1C7_GOSTO|nr:hypothetical protein ES332_A04G143900v1 [Gossypium tomentosum]